jgi:pyrroline-5-carboxylate reductase
VHVENERQIDMATALSATGPTYVFVVMEALVDAGVHMGFSRHVAQDLVHQTMLGAVLFARESHKHPAELRNMVTSPGGTSAEAIYQMEKGRLRTVLSKAVWAAYQRAESLGRKI